MTTPALGVTSVTVFTLLSVAMLAAEPLLIREARRTKVMPAARGESPRTGVSTLRHAPFGYQRLTTTLAL